MHEYSVKDTTHKNVTRAVAYAIPNRFVVHIQRRSLSLETILHSVLPISAGAFLVALIVVITGTIPSTRFLFEAHTFGPASEEILKFLAAYALLSIPTPFLIPLPLLGVSFGFFEALHHFEVYGAFGQWAIATHIILGIIMSTCLYMTQKTSNIYVRQCMYACALVIPIVLHFVYNTAIVPHL